MGRVDEPDQNGKIPRSETILANIILINNTPAADAGGPEVVGPFK